MPIPALANGHRRQRTARSRTSVTSAQSPTRCRDCACSLVCEAQGVVAATTGARHSHKMRREAVALTPRHAARTLRLYNEVGKYLREVKEEYRLSRLPLQ